VAVKIKLKRLGKIRAPYYRIVVADARTKRDGRAIEEIGKYHPKAEPSFIEVNSERAQHWLSVGAQPTDPVRKILEITGDWQKFRGLPGTEGTLKTAAPKEDRKEIFAAAVKETLGDAAAAPKGRARSSAARDAESSAKGGKAAAKDSSPARAEKPARARAKDAETKSAEPKSAEPKSAEAKSADAKSADAKSADAKSGDAKSGAAKGSAAKGSAQDKAGDAADGAAGAEAPDAASAAAEPAARTADAESASGD
jgi:small subunit ribosomal protein S16